LSDPSPQDERLGRLIPLLPQLIMGLKRNRGAVPAELLPAGRLGPRHVAALVSLAVRGPATVGELAQRQEMTLAHASLVVGELAKVGLVERRPDEQDRRRTIVSVAPEHAQTINRMAAGAAAPLVTFLEELGDDRADRFIEDLALLVAHLRTEHGEGEVPEP
jgi:DNA-binding MarR family transcriptional regulator